MAMIAKPITKGERYGRLVLIKELKDLPHRQIKCRCDCGNIRIARLAELKRGKSTSCGCLTKERLAARPKRITHGMSNHPLYQVYHNMMSRCYNPSNKSYADYGGRGIKVCRKWRESKDAFLTWAVKKGWAEDLELDRRNNNKGYKPSNCRFVTKTKNRRNARSNIIVEYKGRKMTLSEAVERYGKMDYGIVHYRVTHGWPIGKALKTRKWGYKVKDDA